MFNNNKNITKLNLQINITSHDILNLFYNLKYHIISYDITSINIFTFHQRQRNQMRIRDR